MSRVDFYVLPENDADRQRFACALVQKVWKAGNRVCLFTDDREQADKMDELLWTFRDISFLPHALADTEDAATVAVLISWDDSAAESLMATDVLVNLADRIPPATDKFDRIAEIVGGSTDERQAARDRYRQYQRQGHELQTHTIERT